MSIHFFHPVDFHEAPDLFKFQDRALFQTYEWLNFLSETQNVQPVIAVLKEGDNPVGRFTGCVLKRVFWLFCFANWANYY